MKNCVSPSKGNCLLKRVQSWLVYRQGWTELLTSSINHEPSAYTPTEPQTSSLLVKLTETDLGLWGNCYYGRQHATVIPAVTSQRQLGLLQFRSYSSSSRPESQGSFALFKTFEAMQVRPSIL